MGKINDIAVSKNFKLYEFQCNDGSQTVKIDPEVIERLQNLRDIVGKPVKINSGYRTPEYNKKVGGTSNSQHVLGKAVDVVVKGIPPSEIARIGKSCGFRGIGTYKTFTHLDVRKEYSEWNG
jgi:zinc D-Ala-D-Ala carboxypeptidase